MPAGRETAVHPGRMQYSGPCRGGVIDGFSKVGKRRWDLLSHDRAGHVIGGVA